jgi:hypothetical protein
LRITQETGRPNACSTTPRVLTEVYRLTNHPLLSMVFMFGLVENLAAGSGGATIAQLFKLWTNESTSYDPSNPIPSHFTQVVWKGTTQLGCAIVNCPAGTVFPVRTLSFTFIH